MPSLATTDIDLDTVDVEAYRRSILEKAGLPTTLLNRSKSVSTNSIYSTNSICSTSSLVKKNENAGKNSADEKCSDFPSSNGSSLQGNIQRSRKQAQAFPAQLNHQQIQISAKNGPDSVHQKNTASVMAELLSRHKARTNTGPRNSVALAADTPASSLILSAAMLKTCTENVPPFQQEQLPQECLQALNSGINKGISNTPTNTEASAFSGNWFNLGTCRIPASDHSPHYSSYTLSSNSAILQNISNDHDYGGADCTTTANNRDWLTVKSALDIDDHSNLQTQKIITQQVEYHAKPVLVKPAIATSTKYNRPQPPPPPPPLRLDFLKTPSSSLTDKGVSNSFEIQLRPTSIIPGLLRLEQLNEVPFRDAASPVLSGREIYRQYIRAVMMEPYGEDDEGSAIVHHSVDLSSTTVQHRVREFSEKIDHESRAAATESKPVVQNHSANSPGSNPSSILSSIVDKPASTRLQYSECDAALDIDQNQQHQSSLSQTLKKLESNCVHQSEQPETGCENSEHFNLTGNGSSSPMVAPVSESKAQILSVNVVTGDWDSSSDTLQHCSEEENTLCSDTSTRSTIELQEKQRDLQSESASSPKIQGGKENRVFALSAELNDLRNGAANVNGIPEPCIQDIAVAKSSFETSNSDFKLADSAMSRPEKGSVQEYANSRSLSFFGGSTWNRDFATSFPGPSRLRSLWQSRIDENKHHLTKNQPRKNAIRWRSTETLTVHAQNSEPANQTHFAFPRYYSFVEASKRTVGLTSPVCYRTSRQPTSSNNSPETTQFICNNNHNCGNKNNTIVGNQFSADCNNCLTTKVHENRFSIGSIDDHSSLQLANSPRKDISNMSRTPYANQVGPRWYNTNKIKESVNRESIGDSTFTKSKLEQRLNYTRQPMDEQIFANNNNQNARSYINNGSLHHNNYSNHLQRGDDDEEETSISSAASGSLLLDNGFPSPPPSAKASVDRRAGIAQDIRNGLSEIERELRKYDEKQRELQSREPISQRNGAIKLGQDQVLLATSQGQGRHCGAMNSSSFSIEGIDREQELLLLYLQSRPEVVQRLGIQLPAHLRNLPNARAVPAVPKIELKPLPLITIDSEYNDNHRDLLSSYQHKGIDHHSNGAATKMKSAHRYIKNSAKPMNSRKLTTAATGEKPNFSSQSNGRQQQKSNSNNNNDCYNDGFGRSGNLILREILEQREREEELRRSRSLLGLPSLDDILYSWRHRVTQPNPKHPQLRSRCQSLDHLTQAVERELSTVHLARNRQDQQLSSSMDHLQLAGLNNGHANGRANDYDHNSGHATEENEVIMERSPQYNRRHHSSAVTNSKPINGHGQLSNGSYNEALASVATALSKNQSNNVGILGGQITMMPSATNTNGCSYIDQLEVYNKAALITDCNGTSCSTLSESSSLSVENKVYPVRAGSGNRGERSRTVEARIELEVEEFKRREEELRRQRQQLQLARNGVPTNDLRISVADSECSEDAYTSSSVGSSSRDNGIAALETLFASRNQSRNNVDNTTNTTANVHNNNNNYKVNNSTNYSSAYVRTTTR